MHRRPGEQVAQRADAHIDIAVLQQQLDGNGEGQQGGGVLRQAEQHHRQHAAECFEQLVQRVLHQAVETVHTLDAVVHRMQPPEQRQAMAGVMHQSDAEVRQRNRQQQLQGQRPVRRPQRVQRRGQHQQRHAQHREQIQAFVDQRMQQVAAAIAS
ncbi:MAG: hypothetical protein GAK45_01876 [Pseudomonas citronellolis]|nr:MAG: hypothetical protein GAK45_01876 [Pseudomonas citronellolis]